MLNTLCAFMDCLAHKFKLCKDETIGDAHMRFRGLPKEDDAHLENVANFELAVNKCVTLVKSPLIDESNRLRMNIHAGECVAGVVGNLAPPCCLFGDMTNANSRHESAYLEDMIQASSATYGKLKRFSEDASDHCNWTPRGLVEMKGKGESVTCWLDSGTKENQHIGPKPMERLCKEVEYFWLPKRRRRGTIF